MIESILHSNTINTINHKNYIMNETSTQFTFLAKDLFIWIILPLIGIIVYNHLMNLILMDINYLKNNYIPKSDMKKIIDELDKLKKKFDLFEIRMDSDYSLLKTQINELSIDY